MRDVAIFLPNWVGDAVMATPALRSFRQGFDQGVRLVGICKPVIGSLLEGTQWLDDFLIFPPFGKSDLHVRLGIIKRLRKESFDTAILFPNSFESAFIAWVAGFHKRIGYGRDCRSWLLTNRLAAPRIGRNWEPISTIDYYLHIASYLGCGSEDKGMELALTTRDLLLHRKLFVHMKFSPERHTIVINNSGAFGDSKRWPEAYVCNLSRLLANDNYQVILHCGPGERNEANAIAYILNNPKVQSMGIMNNLPIGLSKSVLAHASLVVTTDSGPRHIALAFNKPVVTLFGPTDYSWTTTYNVSESVMGEDLSCRACWKSHCPHGHHNCMVKLSVEKVYSEIRERMSKL